jgi:hypothetical protein
MFRHLAVVLLVLSCATATCAPFRALAQDIQQERQERYSGYMDHAEIRRVANSITVSANFPRPLAQALTAISEEYAWTIDFEDPPYHSKYDLVDDTAPEWRAAHPNEKGVTGIGGGLFETQFQENSDTGPSPAEEQRVLEAIVLDYNRSGNPGRFAVIDEGQRRFAVVGTRVKDDNGNEQPVNSILDTPITVPAQTRDAYQTIRSILEVLAAKTHMEIAPGAVPINALLQSKVIVGGQDVPSRVLLQQALSSARLKFYWHLYYDSDGKTYALNVLLLKKAIYDASGNRTTVWVQP